MLQIETPVATNARIIAADLDPTHQAEMLRSLKKIGLVIAKAAGSLASVVPRDDQIGTKRQREGRSGLYLMALSKALHGSSDT